MSIDIDEALQQINLKTLADLSTYELQHRRCNSSVDDRYCVELFRRALVEQTDEVWSALQQCFNETVRSWLWSHPSHDVALLRDSEENYIAQTFSRFWYAVRDQQLEFTTLPAALRYLHATLNGILTDTLRSHLRGRAREVSLPEPGCSEPAAVEVAVYRITQEALANVAHHAQARRCCIQLRTDDALHLEISDDGLGLPAEHHMGVGLLSMRERAAELGGTCVIEAAVAGGTRVYARLPLPKE